MSRRALRLRPVNSVKHIVDTNGTISAALVSTTDVTVAVNDPATASVNEVMIGSTVHAIFLRVEVVGTVAAGGVDNIYMSVYKNPGGDLAGPNPSAVGGSDDKKRVLHQEMLMLTPLDLNNGVGFPRTLFKGVIVLPRALKRMGIQDKLQVLIAHRLGEATQTTRFCLQCIYKEFR